MPSCTEVETIRTDDRRNVETQRERKRDNVRERAECSRSAGLGGVAVVNAAARGAGGGGRADRSARVCVRA